MAIGEAGFSGTAKRLDGASGMNTGGAPRLSTGYEGMRFSNRVAGSMMATGEAGFTGTAKRPVGVSGITPRGAPRLLPEREEGISFTSRVAGSMIGIGELGRGMSGNGDIWFRGIP